MWNDIIYLALIVVVWNLGRASLRADIAERANNAAKRRHMEDATDWNNRGYYR